MSILRLGAVLVLVGVVAFLGIHFRPAESSGEPPVAMDEPNVSQSFDPRARLVAERFILTAVARKNTGASWKLLDPAFPARSDFTKREWARGDIPVVPTRFPLTKNAIRLSVAGVYEHGDELLLDVVLGPGRKHPGVFKLALTRHGNGAKRRWLVNYWMTRYVHSGPGGCRPAAPCRGEATKVLSRS